MPWLAAIAAAAGTAVASAASAVGGAAAGATGGAAAGGAAGAAGGVAGGAAGATAGGIAGAAAPAAGVAGGAAAPTIAPAAAGAAPTGIGGALSNIGQGALDMGANLIEGIGDVGSNIVEGAQDLTQQFGSRPEPGAIQTPDVPGLQPTAEVGTGLRGATGNVQHAPGHQMPEIDIPDPVEIQPGGNLMNKIGDELKGRFKDTLGVERGQDITPKNIMRGQVKKRLGYDMVNEEFELSELMESEGGGGDSRAAQEAARIQPIDIDTFHQGIRSPAFVAGFTKKIDTLEERLRRKKGPKQ